MTTVPSHSNRPRRRVWPWVVGGIGLIIAVFVALFAYDGWQLMASADALEEHAGAAQEAVSARESDALATEVVLMQEAADDFASHTSGPHWTVASWIPWVKDQTLPLQQAGRSAQAVGADALGPLSTMGNLDALAVPPVEGGRIDPYVLEPYRESLAEAATVLSEQRTALDGIALESTVAPVREPFLTLQAQVATLGDLVQGAHVAAELMPPMLGAEGERTYIVMVQNNAEPRTTGGIAGAVIELGVSQGLFTFQRFLPAWEMEDRVDEVATITDDERRVFTSRMAHYPQDVNFTPEFPRSAELLSEFWQHDQGSLPDGVISTDPVGLGYMLEGMDAVMLDGIEITGEKLADVMLNEVYFRYDDPQAADAFFALASRELFGRLLAGDGTSLTAGLERASAEQRLLLWSAEPLEQELLATTGIAGDFMARDDALGVYINDGSGSKIGYYVESELVVADHLCASDGSLGSQTVELTLTHSYDGDVDDLPEYIGIGGDFVPNGEFHANVVVFPPTGMGVTHFTRDGTESQLAAENVHSRELSESRVALVPGETVRLEYELHARERGIPHDVVVQTPGPKLNVYSRAVDSTREDC